jgi:hypothetical protein
MEWAGEAREGRKKAVVRRGERGSDSQSQGGARRGVQGTGGEWSEGEVG